MAADPIQATTDEARATARRLIADATSGALGVLIDGRPMVTRVALVRDADGTPVTLVSDLAPHTGALRAQPFASLMIGEPGERGDPLIHPRLTLQVCAAFVQKTEARKAQYLAQYPKATLYFDFADFHLVRLVPEEAFLNGGFGKAYRLTPADLGVIA